MSAASGFALGAVVSAQSFAPLFLREDFSTEVSLYYALYCNDIVTLGSRPLYPQMSPFLCLVRCESSVIVRVRVLQILCAPSADFDTE